MKEEVRGNVMKGGNRDILRNLIPRKSEKYIHTYTSISIPQNE